MNKFTNYITRKRYSPRTIETFSALVRSFLSRINTDIDSNFRKALKAYGTRYYYSFDNP